MNCQQIRQAELHEKYILDRMGKDEKSRFESHLSGCPTCRAEFQQQKNLILGIKQVGREELKQEIRQQVAELETSTSAVNWGSVAKIAAVLFVMIITPAVYFVVKDQPAQKMPAFEAKQYSVDDSVKSEEPPADESASAPIAGTPHTTRARKPAPPENAVRSSDASLQEKSEGGVDLPRTESEPRLSTIRDREALRQDLLVTPKPEQVASDVLDLDRATKKFLQVDSLAFHAGNSLVIVKLNYSDMEPARDEGTGLPRAIPVTVAQLDSSRIELLWQVPFNFAPSKITDAHLMISDDFVEMTFKFADGRKYHIDLGENPKRAILVQ